MVLTLRNDALHRFQNLNGMTITLRANVRALLACPLCHQDLDIADGVAFCAACGFERSQPDPEYLDLRPLKEESRAWPRRQAAMERWYRELLSDSRAAVNSFEYDYSELAPILATITGRVLDVGGGLGLARKYLVSIDEYVNVDPADFWRELPSDALRAQLPVLFEPHEFICAHGEHLPLRDGSVDAGLALWSLNHATDPRAMMHELHRVLRPGGRLLVVLDDIAPTREDVLARPQLARQGAPAEPPQDRVRITEDQLADYAAGFSLVERRWVRHYLLAEFRRDEGGADRSPRSGVTSFTTFGDAPRESARADSSSARHARSDRRASYTSIPSRIDVRSLLWTIVRTDFKLRYHGSLGGFAWALLRPLSLFVILQAVFSLIFQTDAQYRFNLVIGLFLWDFFAESTKSGLTSLATKAHLMTKVSLPRWLLVVTSASNALVTLSLFVVIIVTSLAVAGHPVPLLHAGLFVLYLLHFLAIITGFSLAASVLFLKYRDLNQLWDLIVQVGFFAAPIVYPLRILPERIHFYLYCWAPTPVIQFSRSVLVDGVVPTAKAHMLLTLEAAAALAIGTFIFRRYSPRAAEYL